MNDKLMETPDDEEESIDQTPSGCNYAAVYEKKLARLNFDIVKALFEHFNTVAS